MMIVHNFFCRSVHFHRTLRILSSTIFTSAGCTNKSLNNSRIKNFQRKSLENQKNKFEDTFGDIENFGRTFEKILDDPEDILEYQRSKAAKCKTAFQYMQEIKNFLENNDYKSAINVLEIDMVNDKIPLNRLIYKILINYNAQIGNLQEAYRLFIAYKSRQGLVTGAFYTSIFNACANCKNSFLALEKANATRECMNRNKFHSINISNYNAMLKAYGRHGDIPSCMKIMDEVLEKRKKVKSKTYSFLLQACISDRNSGLRHALLVWRKMIKNRIKPEIFSFNLMLRCVRDCSLGDTLLIPDFIEQIMHDNQFFIKRKVKVKIIKNEYKRTVLKIPTTESGMIITEENEVPQSQKELKKDLTDTVSVADLSELSHSNAIEKVEMSEKSNLGNSQTENFVNILELNKSKCEDSCNSVDSFSSSDSSLDEKEEKIVEVNFSQNEWSESDLPNFLLLKPTTGSVIKFGIMTQPQHRFLLVGGVKGFLKTLAEFGVKPNLKTFTLMLDVIPSTLQAEEELITLTEAYKIQLDTAFFNVLIKRRISRKEDILVKDCLKRMHALNLKPDLLTFETLAHSCNTYETGMELLQTIHNHCYRANCDILTILLKRASYARDIKYVHAILQAAKEDDTHLNAKFLALLSNAVKKEQYLRRIEREDAEKTSNANNLVLES